MTFALRVDPGFGARRADSLTAADLDAYYLHLQQHDKLSPSSVRQVHAVLSGALAQAVKWRWLAEIGADALVDEPLVLACGRGGQAPDLVLPPLVEEHAERGSGAGVASGVGFGDETHEFAFGLAFGAAQADAALASRAADGGQARAVRATGVIF